MTTISTKLKCKPCGLFYPDDGYIFLCKSCGQELKRIKVHDVKVKKITVNPKTTKIKTR